MIIHEHINLGAKIPKQDADRQKKTVNKLLSLLEHEPGIILADEVGMGKTFVALATALTYIANIDHNKRILILTPSKELKDKWNKDIDTFRVSCIKEKSPIKKLAKNKGIDSIKEFVIKKRVPILIISLNRIAGKPKEDEIKGYLGAYFRQRRFSIDKRKEMLKILKNNNELKSIGNVTDSLVMNPERWAFNSEDDFLQYENFKDLDFKPFDDTIRKGNGGKDFIEECRKIRNQLIPSFAFCIIDEAHNYKNPWTIGHRLFNNNESPESTLKGKFEKMLFLTATPFELGYDELLNIFKMFNVAKTCSPYFDNKVDNLKKLLYDYTKSFDNFEDAWLHFSKTKGMNASEEEKKEFLDNCKEYEKAHEAKLVLEPQLRNLIIRNVKNKDHRRIFVGSCINKSTTGIEIPDKDKPLFFSILRLEREILRVNKNVFNGLTDSMATSAYSTLKNSKMIKDSSWDSKNVMISKYRQIIDELTPQKDDTHPKIKDVVERVIERYRNGEKSLIFTFYIKSANALKEVLKNRIHNERANRFKGIKKGMKNINNYIKNTQNKFSSPNDFRYLIMKENLLLTHYQSILREKNIRPDEDDWKQITQYLGENGYKFSVKKRENYRLLLKVMEHHFFKTATEHKRIKERDNIVKRVLDDDYIRNGLYITDEEKLVQKQNVIKYSVNEDDLKHVKGLRAVQYILNGPNIWSYHKEFLKKIDNLELRRIIQSYLLREITREDLIIEQFISAKYADEDENWINVINKIYTKEAMFNKTFKPETLRERVDRWLDIIVSKYENIKTDEDSEEEIRKLIDIIKEMKNIKNDEDIREIHSESEVNRSIYFEAFNSPFRPVVLICTSIGSEGIDLQQECSGVFLYDLGWNPATLEQKIGRIDRIGSKNSREREIAEHEKLKLPQIEIYRPFIKGTRDERMHRVLQHREKWFNLLLGSGKRLSYGDDENGDGASIFDVEKEERMIPLPDYAASKLTMNLGL